MGIHAAPSSPKGAHQPPVFSAHVCCGQTVAHLTYCWALVNNVCVAGCLERSHCWNPLVVGTAYDNASVVVTLTSPPASFEYEAYDVYLKQGSKTSYLENVLLQVRFIHHRQSLHDDIKQQRMKCVFVGTNICKTYIKLPVEDNNTLT